jgi:hypothetical protein
MFFNVYKQYEFEKPKLLRKYRDHIDTHFYTH